MICDSITTQEFRQNPAAVKAWQDFLQSAEGQLFAKALRGAHPTTQLAKSLTDARSIRDSAIVESSTDGSAHNLLGKAEGYSMCLSVLDELTKVITPNQPAPARSAERITKTIRRQD